jgi:hypothetical protein
MKTKVAFSGHHEALILLLDNNLRLDEGLLGLNINLLLLNDMRLVHDNDSWSTLTHTHEFGSHVNEAASVKLDSLFTRSMLSEDAQGNVGFTDCLHGVTLVLDDDVHMVLEHVGGDLHELHHPSGLLTSVMGGLGVPNLLADLDVDEGRHLVQGSTNFIVEFSVYNVKFEEALSVHDCFG